MLGGRDALYLAQSPACRSSGNAYASNGRRMAADVLPRLLLGGIAVREL